MAPGRFILELSSEELNDQSIHVLLETIGRKKLTARFLTDVRQIEEEDLGELPDSRYATANQAQCEQLLSQLRGALSRIPYLRVVTSSAKGGVPYMVNLTVRNARIDALIEAVKADVAAVIKADVVHGRKVAQVVRDMPHGFELLLAIMDDAGYFVTSRLAVLLGNG
jgi:hypothetical protein